MPVATLPVAEAPATGIPRLVPQAARPYARHIPALDGIRGLAVLAVVASHLFPGNARTPITKGLQFTFASGASGVDLFFLLSGFLITGILFDSLGERHYFRLFYMRRILRIFPLYYAVLAAYAMGALVFGTHFNKELWSLAVYGQNTALIAQPGYAYAGPTSLPLSHFWSLAVEEQFYFVWPFLVLWAGRRKPLLLLCGLMTLACPVARAALWLHGCGYYPVHQNTLLRSDALLAGAALALLLRSRVHDTVLRAAPWMLWCGAAAVAGIMLSEIFSLGHASWWPWTRLSLRYTAFDVLFSGFLLLALRSGTVARLCAAAPLRALGRYSYGIYVLHAILFHYLQRPLHHVLESHLTSNRAWDVAWTGLITLALSFLAAVASFHLVEARFLHLKKYFRYGQPVRSGTVAGSCGLVV